MLHGNQILGYATMRLLVDGLKMTGGFRLSGVMSADPSPDGVHARGGTSHGNYCCVNCIATLLEAVLFNVVAFLTFTILSLCSVLFLTHS